MKLVPLEQKLTLGFLTQTKEQTFPSNTAINNVFPKALFQSSRGDMLSQGSTSSDLRGTSQWRDTHHRLLDSFRFQTEGTGIRIKIPGNGRAWSARCRRERFVSASTRAKLLSEKPSRKTKSKLFSTQELLKSGSTEEKYADIVAAPLTMSSSREEIIDYINPFKHTGTKTAKCFVWEWLADWSIQNLESESGGQMHDLNSWVETGQVNSWSSSRQTPIVPKFLQTKLLLSSVPVYVSQQPISGLVMVLKKIPKEDFRPVNFRVTDPLSTEVWIICTAAVLVVRIPNKGGRPQWRLYNRSLLTRISQHNNHACIHALLLPWVTRMTSIWLS